MSPSGGSDGDAERDDPSAGNMVPDDIAYDAAGLVPGIVQDADTAQVLMLGWLNGEAVRLTAETGQVHFWSRSRSTIWRKGETSGNTLEVVDVQRDCDGDTLLITARPAGPTCHTGDVSCFSATRATGFAALDELWATIADRLERRPAGSYTVRLTDGGVDAVARKVAEEATEVVIAAKDHAAAPGDPTHLIEESADLVYHLLALLAERGVDPADVVAELRNRR